MRAIRLELFELNDAGQFQIWLSLKTISVASSWAINHDFVVSFCRAKFTQRILNMSWGERTSASLISRPQGVIAVRRLSRHSRGDWSFCSNQKYRTARRPCLRLRLRSRRFGQHWNASRRRCRHPLLRQPSHRLKFHSRRLQAPASRGRKST